MLADLKRLACFSCIISFCHASTYTGAAEVTFPLELLALALLIIPVGTYASQIKGSCSIVRGRTCL